MNLEENTCLKEDYTLDYLGGFIFYLQAGGEIKKPVDKEYIDRILSWCPLKREIEIRSNADYKSLVFDFGHINNVTIESKIDIIGLTVGDSCSIKANSNSVIVCGDDCMVEAYQNSIVHFGSNCDVFMHNYSLAVSKGTNNTIQYFDLKNDYTSFNYIIYPKEGENVYLRKGYHFLSKCDNLFFLNSFIIQNARFLKFKK